MESRIARQYADKIGPYLDKHGKWNPSKSERRREQTKALLVPRVKPLPITRFELSFLLKAERGRTMNKLLSAIFSQIKNKKHGGTAGQKVLNHRQ